LKIISLNSNEIQLINQAVLADRQAQLQLYKKYSPKMLSVCRQYIKDLQFAEDVMVNGFVKVFKFLKTFKNEGSFEGWVRKIMVRECISYLRKQQFVVYDDDLFENNNTLNSIQSSELDVAHIQLLIDALPTGYRTVFILYTVEGYKHQEIAEMLDISESTSKSQLSKARKSLKEKLKQQKIIGYGTK
jgi:RNA polymerase sigma-70 factor (ECF subfamily)